MRSSCYVLSRRTKEGATAEVWIKCPDCGESIVSNRYESNELLDVHRPTCPLRTERVIDLRTPAPAVVEEPVTT